MSYPCQAELMPPDEPRFLKGMRQLFGSPNRQGVSLSLVYHKNIDTLGNPNYTQQAYGGTHPSWYVA